MNQPKIPPARFDWSKLPLALFRGPGLSFPVSMSILIAPSFNTLVINAANCFVQDFTGHKILDADNDSFPIEIMESTTEPDGTIHKLRENSFGLRMKYICEAEKTVVLTLGYDKRLITWH